MKVWVYVEGRSDVGALEALWGEWKLRLNDSGWGIKMVPLKSKHEYLRKIGPRATEKLKNDPRDLVVGLPDLYPNRGISDNYKHRNLNELQVVQNRLVRRELEKRGMSRSEVESHIARFHANAMKHDMEVLLLGSTGQLQSRLKMSNEPGGWRQPPEDQNQDSPPKRIVQELFQRHLKRSYRENTDSEAILRAADIQDIVQQCPTFSVHDRLDWQEDGRTRVLMLNSPDASSEYPKSSSLSGSIMSIMDGLIGGRSATMVAGKRVKFRVEPNPKSSEE